MDHPATPKRHSCFDSTIKYSKYSTWGRALSWGGSTDQGWLVDPGSHGLSLYPLIGQV